ncbi:cytochrome P450 4V2 [Parasteatoda tepidariorum]|uniref:cytochrome P450 4V2 n=1 Tax=Parasteatoda tepidariorum TaxID=114398 RepID=UPI001C722367|nr:cytochrome P450 4V2 [Parasteatoda tepidariorum]
MGSSKFLEISAKSLTFTNVVFTAFIAWVIFSIIIFLKYAFRRTKYSKMVPCKKVGFFNVLGNIGDLQQDRSKYNFNTYLLQLASGLAAGYFRKEKLFCLWLSYAPNIIVTKAEAVEDLIAGTKTMKKGWSYNFLHTWLGTGLLTSDGPKWKSRRRLLTPSFHFEILKDFMPTFAEKSDILVKVLRKETEKEFVDIVMPVTLCSLDIICETTLGVNIGAQENKDSEYVRAVLRVSETMMERMFNPKYWLEATFALTELGKQQKKDIKLLHNFTDSVIQEKKTKLLSGGETTSEKRKRKALMDVLLEHHVQTKELTEHEIREEVDTFAFEGHDTTSMGISWALYLIGLHKDVQDKIHEEMDRIFGDDRDRLITTDDLKDMTYLDLVLKESQRLYPSVPLIAREVTENEITICGYKVPKGTQCVALIYNLHRDEKVFPNPEKFDPDRFLPENSVGRHPFAYIPFSAGPRNCIGQRFALMEEKVVVSNVLRHFTLESLDQRDQLPAAVELILRSPVPIRIKIRAR